jgi:hypothetical protein
MDFKDMARAWCRRSYSEVRLQEGAGAAKLTTCMGGLWKRVKEMSSAVDIWPGMQSRGVHGSCNQRVIQTQASG